MNKAKKVFYGLADSNAALSYSLPTRLSLHIIDLDDGLLEILFS